MDVRKFLIKVTLFSPIVLIMIVVNYLVGYGPARFNYSAHLENISRIMVSGKNIGNSFVLKLDQRILNRCLINGFSGKKQVVVLGSSRTREVNYTDFSGYSFFNNSMDSASLEDDITTYWMYRKRNILPNVIIIGLDPWLLNKNIDADEYKILGEEYSEAAEYIFKDVKKRRVRIPGFYIINYLQAVLSPTSFQVSYYKARLSKSELMVTEEFETNDWLIRSDGSQNWPKSLKKRSAAEVEINVKKDMSFFEKPLKKYYFLEKQRFEEFVGVIQDDKVKVIFYLMPFHPTTYNLLLKSEKFRIVADAEVYFREYSLKYGIELYGSYDPKVNGIAENDFYDCVHAKWDSIKQHYRVKSLEIK